MVVVSLTFPGHFFQTKLSINSIRQWYDVDRHYVIVDDYEKGPWDTYFQDACDYYGDGLDFIATSSMPHLQNTLSGWWRQQLIKLTLDKILPEQSWLAVDGDVIFETFCPYQDLVPVASRSNNFDGAIETFTRNYVQNLLGTQKGSIYYNGKFCMTNPVPYRFLTRELLAALRSHVESRFECDFVEQHIKWFHDRTMVGMHHDMTKWNMSEWELIEVFRREVLGVDLPELDIGSGYQLDVDLTNLPAGVPVFRHGYKRDGQLDRDWFVNQGLTISDSLWQQSRGWLEAKESWRA